MAVVVIEVEKLHVVEKKLRVVCRLVNLRTFMTLATREKFADLEGATTAQSGLTNVLEIKDFILRFVQTISSVIPLDALPPP